MTMTRIERIPMSRISNDELDRLKRKVDLVQLAERYGVKFEGATPKASCPFHAEKTPSFVAHQNPNDGGPPRYHCYGACGRSWDAIDFIQTLTGQDFRTAVATLDPDHVVPFISPNASAGRDPRHQRQPNNKEQVLRALAAAQEYFTQNLRDAASSYAKTARAYVAERQLEDALETWGIGYAPPGRQFIRWMEKRGFDNTITSEAYLVRTNEERGERYPFFRHRLMFPQHDFEGRIIAYVGRAIEHEKPKYLNSGTIPGVFTKGENLFGIYQSRDAIRSQRCALIVEGQIDCISMHCYGFRHTVATGGTAFTEMQARLLRKAGATRLTWIFDADAAGFQAVDRAQSICVSTGLESHELFLPSGSDPDNFLRAQSPL